uniref:Uncharacterized protein n=1 Tax=Sus scrofa TaxID=9823 RepID=A0A4X1SJX8_PIG
GVEVSLHTQRRGEESGQYAHSGLFILVMIYPGFKREADAGVAKPTVLRSMTLDL